MPHRNDVLDLIVIQVLDQFVQGVAVIPRRIGVDPALMQFGAFKREPHVPDQGAHAIVRQVPEHLPGKHAQCFHLGGKNLERRHFFSLSHGGGILSLFRNHEDATAAGGRQARHVALAGLPEAAE